MGFFSKLFGQSEPKPRDSIEYKGFQITVTPRNQDGQYGVGATITKSIDGKLHTHQFIRADTLPSEEVCEEITLSKARATIDQQGDRIFSSWSAETAKQG